MAVQEHAPLLRVVEAGQQPRNGALPRAGGADEGERLPWRDMQLEPVEHGAVAVVAEAHRVEPHIAAQRPLELRRVTRLPQARLGLEHLEDPAARRERLLYRRHALAQHAQRPDEHHDVGVERDEGAHREIAGDHTAAPEPEHGGDPEQRQHLEHRDEDRVEPGEIHRPAEDLVAAAAEARRERVAGAEPLHHADAADGFLDEVEAAPHDSCSRRVPRSYRRE